MYELIQASGSSYYIDCPAKIGLVCVKDQDVVLIDSGSDKDAGRKVRKILDEHGWRLRAIFNTHSHADHIGGNRFLQERTGCKIYAPGTECAFSNHVIFEPSFLYGGRPPKDLRHKFLMAQESKVETLREEVLPEGFEWIPLPGHSMDMAGFRTADDVVYLADCVSSAETIEKYQINYLYDPEAYLETLERVKAMQAKLFVPSHSEPTEDIVPLAQMNIDKVNEIAEIVTDICGEPQEFEKILREMFTRFNLTMTVQQYALIGSTLRSYLAWLQNRGVLDIEIDDARLLWRKI